MKEPLTALERLRRATKEVAVIETEALWVRHHEDESLLAFYPGDELSADFGNWYAPNERALHALCRAAGFGRVVTVAGPPPLHPLGPLKGGAAAAAVAVAQLPAHRPRLPVRFAACFPP